MATATAPEPLLNLDTIAPAASVIIDGVPYAIQSPDGLTLMGLRQVRPMIVRLELLRGEITLTDEQAAEEKALLNGVCRVVLSAPDAVQDKLSDLQRMAIYTSFLSLPSSMLHLLGARTLTGATLPTVAKMTGAKSSRSSNGSTRAGARSTGSRASRAASSGPSS